MTSLLPFPELQFFDNDGVPLSGGTVATYIPGTTTPKITWQDSGQITANEPIITLDSAGRCLVYGSGSYRFIVKDSLGNLIYDQLTTSALSESAISAAMLPVVGASTTASAFNLIGGNAAIAAAISQVELLPGSVGATGPAGPTGPTGPAGPSSGSNLNRQVFSGSGTWSKPSGGTFAIIQLWGSGGAGSSDGGGFWGGGGAGGYTMVMCLLSDLASAVSVTVGAGGAYTGSFAGTNGGTTSFGSYLVQAGGIGGTYATDGFGDTFPVDGTSGYLQSASGLTLIMGSFDDGTEQGKDNLFNKYAAAPFSGSTGQDSALNFGYPSIFGGSGGTSGGNGTAPGGGGAGNGGSGGNGQVIVTCF